MMMSSSVPVALLDRLGDENVPPRESVRRELIRLFNARAPQETEELPPLLVWGMPEWHGLNADDERAFSRFCRQLRSAILRLEPRIVALTVSVKDARQQTLALHIDAQLWNDDAPLLLELCWRNGNWQ